jgi:glycosyltransferase involved in cell wall biosynthesis
MSEQLPEHLRILLINDFGAPNGGAELQMLALRKGLRERGHAVRLLSSDARPVAGLRIEADRMCRGARAATQFANPWAWAAVRDELVRHPTDIVHIRMFLWQLSPLILPALASVPTLFQAATYKAICPTGLKLLPGGMPCNVSPGRVCRDAGCVDWRSWTASMAQLALLRRWRGHIDRVAALSTRMARLMQAEGWGDVEVMGNGVDPRPARPPLGEVPLVAFGGRLVHEKGVDTLIAAFERVTTRLPEARLIIAGTGPLEPDLRARAVGLGDRVAFLGHLARDQMEAAFDAAWVQVVPSLWPEPFGNVSTEAMMRGTAVIASDVGGQSDIVRDGRTGYLVPPGDVTALADRLLRLLGDRTRAEAFGAAGRRVAQAEYSREAALDQLERTYRDMIAARAVSRPAPLRRAVRSAS